MVSFPGARIVRTRSTARVTRIAFFGLEPTNRHAWAGVVRAVNQTDRRGAVSFRSDSLNANSPS